MRIAMAKEAFNRKISLETDKLIIGLNKNFVRCWSIAMYGSETWKLIPYTGRKFLLHREWNKGPKYEFKIPSGVLQFIIL